MWIKFPVEDVLGIPHWDIGVWSWKSLSIHLGSAMGLAGMVLTVGLVLCGVEPDSVCGWSGNAIPRMWQGLEVVMGVGHWPTVKLHCHDHQGTPIGASTFGGP
jgi:hypothetical protein